MLLQRTLDRNPELVAAAIELHQSGAVPAGTYLVDLDAVAQNAALLADEARALGLRTYAMTKSYGRNPFVTGVALAQGLDSTVAVEPREIYAIRRFEQPIGHVGHLANVPLRETPAIIALEPEVVTVYTVEAAKAVSEAARARGRRQSLYVRVNRVGDEIFRAFVGGWTEDECVDAIRPILELPNVDVTGLTSYPCISYSTTDVREARLNSTFFTMLRAKERLELELGLEDLRVNAPANNSVATLRMLAEHGATDVEPGHALLGGSLLHAHNELPEKPAQVYVSEVMHRWAGELYTAGSGMLYIEGYGGAHDRPERCLVGRTFEGACEQPTTMIYRGHVDYYAVCEDVPGARQGDTAIYALHPQYFVNRAYVAAVSGISRGEPRLEMIFDWATNGLDESLQPVPPTWVVERVERLIAERYARAVQ